MKGMTIKFSKPAEKMFGRERLLEWIKFTSHGVHVPRGTLVYLCLGLTSHKAHWKPYQKILFVRLKRECGPFRSLMGYTRFQHQQVPVFNAEEQNIYVLAHEFAHAKQHFKFYGDLRQYQKSGRRHVFSESKADLRARVKLAEWRQLHPVQDPITVVTTMRYCCPIGGCSKETTGYTTSEKLWTHLYDNHGIRETIDDRYLKAVPQ